MEKDNLMNRSSIHFLKKQVAKLDTTGCDLEVNMKINISASISHEAKLHVTCDHHDVMDVTSYELHCDVIGVTSHEIFKLVQSGQSNNFHTYTEPNTLTEC